ncbi:hypothetical protein LINPERHAP1_LOCUS11613 [Linum perenne]
MTSAEEKSTGSIRVSRFDQRFWSLVMKPWMSPTQITVLGFDIRRQKGEVTNSGSLANAFTMDISEHRCASCGSRHL